MMNSISTASSISIAISYQSYFLTKHQSQVIVRFQLQSQTQTKSKTLLKTYSKASQTVKNCRTEVSGAHVTALAATTVQSAMQVQATLSSQLDYLMNTELNIIVELSVTSSTVLLCAKRLLSLSCSINIISILKFQGRL